MAIVGKHCRAGNMRSDYFQKRHAQPAEASHPFVADQTGEAGSTKTTDK